MRSSAEREARDRLEKVSVIPRNRLGTDMVRNILTAHVQGAFFNDDHRAIRDGSEREGFRYLGSPQTSGFTKIRMPARGLSVGIALEDGHVAWGDMMSVQYAAAAGRERLFDPAEAIALLGGELGDRLRNLKFDDLRNEIRELFKPLSSGLPIAASVQYGVSQAVLHAYAHVDTTTIAEVLAEAFHVELIPEPVAIYSQSGDDRMINVQKMILKRVDILPHGLINSAAKFGERGEIFSDFAEWVAAQIRQENDDQYRPILHFDLYGNPGLAFGTDPARIASFIASVADRVAPYKLNIESPADYGGVEAQIEGFTRIRERLDTLGCEAKIVADEWCDTLDDVRKFAEAGAADILQIKMPDVGSITNSFEAVRLCKGLGVGAYLGGSCTETDLSARVSVHVAVASQADMQLAKPGMGVDEALTIVGNEQARLLTTLRAKSVG
jgi:methylaspartate ammonia-lyase